MPRHGRSHPYDVDEQVTITVQVSGYIDSDGDFVPDLDLEDDYNRSVKGYHPSVRTLVSDHLDGEHYISGQFIDDNPDLFRRYGTDPAPTGPPITDDDLKAALASIIGAAPES